MPTDREPEELPEGISLETLKDHAKALHRVARTGDSDACQRAEPYFDAPSTLKLQQAQLVVAREYGFKSWRRLKSFIDIRDARTQVLRKFQDVSARMMPSKALIREHQAANREVLRLTKRWMALRPNEAPWRLAEQFGSSPENPSDTVCGEEGGALRCSFCDKSHYEVPKLIAGRGAFICDECVELCLQIIWEDSREPS